MVHDDTMFLWYFVDDTAVKVRGPFGLFAPIICKIHRPKTNVYRNQ